GGRPRSRRPPPSDPARRRRPLAGRPARRLPLPPALSQGAGPLHGRGARAGGPGAGRRHPPGRLPLPGGRPGRTGPAMSTVPLEAVAVDGGGSVIEGRSPLRLALARLRRDRVAMTSAGAIVVLVVVALAAPLIAHLVGHDPTTQYRE